MTSATAITPTTTVAGNNSSGEEEAQRKKEQGGGETLADLCQTAYLDLLEKQLFVQGNGFDDMRNSYADAILLLDERRKYLAQLKKDGEQLSPSKSAEEKQNENNKRKKNEEEEEKEKKNKEQEGDEFFAGATPPKGMSQEQFQVKLKQHVNKTIDGIVSQAFKESNEVVKARLQIQQGCLHRIQIALRVASPKNNNSNNTQSESAACPRFLERVKRNPAEEEGKVARNNNKKNDNIPRERLSIRKRLPASAAESSFSSFSSESFSSEEHIFPFHKIIDCRQDKKQEGEEKNKIDNKLDEIFSALEIDKCVDEAVNVVSSCEILTSPQSSAACAAGEKNQKNQEQKQYRHELDEEEQARLKQEEEEEERQAKLNSSNNNNETSDSSSNDIKNFIKNFPTTGAEVHRSVFFSYGTTKSNKEEVFGIKGRYLQQQRAQEETEEEKRNRRGLFLRAAEQVCQCVDELNKKEQEKKKKKKEKVKENQEEQNVSYQASVQAHVITTEQLHDLLTDRKQWPSNGLKPRLMREGYYVETAEHPFSNVEECEKILDLADGNYHPSSYFYSRHPYDDRFDTTMFTIRISKDIVVDYESDDDDTNNNDNEKKENYQQDEGEQEEGEKEEKKKKKKKKKVISFRSCLLFVDLPSSERLEKTSVGPASQSFTKGGYLTNNSVMNCLAAMLKDNSGSRVHIPTRDSRASLLSLHFIADWQRHELSKQQKSSSSWSPFSFSAALSSFNIRLLVNVSDEIESYHDTLSALRMSRHLYGSRGVSASAPYSLSSSSSSSSFSSSSSSSSSGIDELKTSLMSSSVLPPLDLAWRFKFEGAVQNTAMSSAGSQIFKMIEMARAEIDEIQRQVQGDV